jgi:ribonuclease-3
MAKISLFGRRLSDRERQIKYFIQSSFGVKPKNLALYTQALTHKSYSNEKSPLSEHNERLEFLGDAILSATAADILFQKYPRKTEGQLTQMRARIVSRENLNILGEKLGIEPYINYQKSKNKFNSLLGNTLESLIGAMYLDLGYDKTVKSLKKSIFNETLNFEDVVLQNIDYKSQLIIQCQRNKSEITFELIEELPDAFGKINFEMAIFIDGEEKARAVESTKRKAEQLAAKMVLDSN